MDRAWLLTLAYGGLLLAIHLVATRATGTLPQGLHDTVGASAGTVVSRAWAQTTAMWFHASWGHIGYNLVVVGLTMPIAIGAFGPRALAMALLISPLAAFAVNLLLILPLAFVWGYAQTAVEPRLVGASIAIFAGAGMAWASWSASGLLKGSVLVGFLVYEVVLAALGVTQAFVGVYHIMGGLMGIGAGLAMRSELS